MHRPLTAWLLALALLAAPCTAGVLAEVESLLISGIGEAVILDWLAAQPGEVAVPTAEELVALRAAGASDRLLAAIVRLARDAALEPAPASQTPSTRIAQSPAPEPSPPAAGPGDGGDGVEVTFEASYSPWFDELDERRDLFVYLDGVPLVYLGPGGPLPGSAEAWRFALRLAPGLHRLRVAQERHLERRGGWRHDVRVASEEVLLEVGSGSEARLEVAFRDSRFGVSGGGPLVVRWEQGETRRSWDGVGGDPERWDDLCDDARAGDRRGRAPAGCVEWADLWPPGAPGRDEVRRQLERVSYRPVPREAVRP